jgi:cysteine synthase A
LLNLIGRTPLVPLNGISDEVGRTILVKIESRSLGGSIKDRPALFMIDDARKRGLLQPDARIVEATSGNMGIGLAQIAVIRHHPITIVMPEGMSQERISHLRALGAIVELTPSAEGMQGAIARAEAIIKKEPGAFIPRQFENPANVEAHYRTTGPEILADLGSVPDGFVSGVGTGGTITGTGRFLREKNPDLQIWALEPETSAVLSGKAPGPHRIQGIGAGFIPKILDMGIFNRVMTVTDRQSIDMAHRLAREEGIMAGISSGANVFGAMALARELPYGSRIVTFICDGYERYFSIEKYLSL